MSLRIITHENFKLINFKPDVVVAQLNADITVFKRQNDLYKKDEPELRFRSFKILKFLSGSFDHS